MKQLFLFLFIVVSFNSPDQNFYFDSTPIILESRIVCDPELEICYQLDPSPLEPLPAQGLLLVSSVIDNGWNLSNLSLESEFGLFNVTNLML